MLAHQIHYDTLTTDLPERGSREWYLLKHYRKLGKVRGRGRLIRFREIQRHKNITIWDTINDRLPKVCESEFYFYAWNVNPVLCAYCGTKLTKENRTVEHIIPRCRGGSALGRENTIPACRVCNFAKGERSLLRWLVIGGMGRDRC
jgi:5-methylcytosine-specific restriction endonuclease McrA